MENKKLFTRSMLVKLLVPLFIEQILAVTIGMADTIMVSSTGEAAVSGVSIVDQINILLIQVFTAMATGGAVIAAQYIGRQDLKNANNAAKQLLYLSTVITLVITTFSLIFNNFILSGIYGNIESEVMSNAVIYFYITAASYPFLAIYNSGAALFRAMGNSKVSMYTSVLMNMMNIIGNAILIYGFKMGVAGAAFATLASRIVGATIMFILIQNPKCLIHVENIFKPEINIAMLKSIFKIGIPNGLESGMFQIGKLLVQRLITSFGTAAIAANAVANSIAGIATIPGAAVGLSMITVVGQCVGAEEHEQAVYYTKNLMKLMYTMMFITNAVIFAFAAIFVSFYNLSYAASVSATGIIRLYAIMSAIIWPVSFGLPNALRASGDAGFTMIISIVSMWVFRIGCCYILALLGFKLNGVWYAMYIDWIFRSAIFIVRFLGGKWKKIKVI